MCIVYILVLYIYMYIDKDAQMTTLLDVFAARSRAVKAAQVCCVYIYIYILVIYVYILIIYIY